MLFEAASFISIRTVVASDSMQCAMAVRIYAALTSKFHRPDTGVLLRGYFDTTTPTNNFYNATDGPVAGGGRGIRGWLLRNAMGVIFEQWWSRYVYRETDEE